MAVPKVALGIGDTIYIMGSNLNTGTSLGREEEGLCRPL